MTRLWTLGVFEHPFIMTNKQLNPKDEWPKVIIIKQTLEAVLAELDPDLADDDDIVANEIGQSMDEIEIESWSEIPRGYEPVLDEPAHIDSYHSYVMKRKN